MSTEEDHVQLVRVAERHKTVLANLVQFYRYDLSEVRNYELSPHGTYPYRYLDHYFVEPAREPLFILAGERLAGFALVRKLDDGLLHLAEFFVLRALRRAGIGRRAATKLFRRFPGDWQLEYDHANVPATRFWPQVVEAVADGPIEARDLYPPDVDYPCRELRFHTS
ncbi:GNAT family N-acetyltransferase [Thermasporomyces composti]|mgnify:CR=1 FL=1|jgi:predicted acetyltransferase|uniref:Putative acetyltransferase n=1 Tax=Thermasporomyces composti TaxID=696763 RepID=A0A3D9V1N1_THECX|nr:GNAT family N-acetyltransferase [Thermasporomyces composti]REF34693.1 putative acetyltransferase [Thermasporomyces composti]